MSSFEELRVQNILDNKRILAEIGLLNPFAPLPRVIKKAPKRKRERDTSGNTPRSKKAFLISKDEVEGCGSLRGERRKSSRLQGKIAPSLDESREAAERELEDECDQKRLKATPNRPNVYGAITGVDIGTLWQTRLEACIAGIHRPTVAGIHGGPEGAYSIALSGGYEDDIDLGECFTYTGEGGRDLKGTKANPKNLRTAAQSKDQTLERGNLALSRNVESGHPIRVLRGYKLKSDYAPEEGYRYDGLYIVERFWYTVGLSGFKVYKFAMKRISEQAPPPWHYNEQDIDVNANSEKYEDRNPQIKDIEDTEFDREKSKKEEMDCGNEKKSDARNNEEKIEDEKQGTDHCVKKRDDSYEAENENVDIEQNSEEEKKNNENEIADCKESRQNEDRAEGEIIVEKKVKVLNNLTAMEEKSELHVESENGCVKEDIALSKEDDCPELTEDEEKCELNNSYFVKSDLESNKENQPPIKGKEDIRRYMNVIKSNDEDASNVESDDKNTSNVKSNHMKNSSTNNDACSNTIDDCDTKEHGCDNTNERKLKTNKVLCDINESSRINIACGGDVSGTDAGCITDVLQTKISAHQNNSTDVRLDKTLENEVGR